LNKKKLRISISYITNFKPAYFLNFNKLQLFKSNKNKKIISRNFFLFLLLLKYVDKNNNLLNTSIFVKPFFKKLLTVLRAPYRHKLSRHQFVLNRFSVLYTIKVDLNKITFNNGHEIELFLNRIKKFYV
jgi:hypothetical protein